MIGRLNDVEDVITQLRNQLNSEEQHRQRVEHRFVLGFLHILLFLTLETILAFRGKSRFYLFYSLNDDY